MATVDAGEVAEWIEDARVWLIPRSGRVRCLRCAAESTSVGGSPHREVFEGGFPGTLELPGLLGNRAVFNSWLAYKIGLDTLSPSGILGRQTMGITEVTAWGGRYAR